MRDVFSVKMVLVPPRGEGISQIVGGSKPRAQDCGQPNHLQNENHKSVLFLIKFPSSKNKNVSNFCTITGDISAGGEPQLYKIEVQ